MYKTSNSSKEKVYSKTVNKHGDLKYQRKYPKHSKVLIKNISQEKNIKDSSSGDFEAIMENMYSEIEQNKALKDDSGDNNAFMSPKKIVYSPENNNNQLIDRFTQISVIRPNLNELNIEQSSDNADNAENEVPNEEYIYSYDPKNGLKLDFEDDGKKNLQYVFENYEPENALILKNEINFSIDGILKDNEKTKYDLKCDELIKKEEEYVNLMNKYNLLVKEMNDLKNKATVTSDKTRDEEKTIEHLDNIVIINNENSRKKNKTKKSRNRRMKSLTINIRKYSSSEERKTRDNSQNGFGNSSTKNDLNKLKKHTPNIMIISKENEFNLTAPLNSLIQNDSTLNKTKKKMKLVKKNGAENRNEKSVEKNEEKPQNINWNLLNKVDNRQSIDYIGKIYTNEGPDNVNASAKNNNTKKVTKKKKKKVMIKKKDKDNNRDRRRDICPSASHSIRKKIKKINLPTIDVKNETLSFNVQKKFIRFSRQTKSIDYKINKSNNFNNNIESLLNNKELALCQSGSLSIEKQPKTKKEDVIENNININIIKEGNNQAANEEDIRSNSLSSQNNQKVKHRIKIPKNIVQNNLSNDNNDNNSENKELSYISSEIKENSVCASEDEKHLIKEKNIDNYNASNVGEQSGEKKKIRYPLKIKIVKYGNKSNKTKNLIDTLFSKLVNKILVKRVLKKWVKLIKRK